VAGLSRGDVRHAVEAALTTWPGKSQQEIANQVGCAQGTVAKVKADVIPRNNVAPATRIDSVGRVQPTAKPHTTEPDGDPDEGETEIEEREDTERREFLIGIQSKDRTWAVFG